MNNIHFVMSSKGGIGKSLVAALLAQYLRENDSSVVCANTDPKMKTFSKFKSLKVADVEIFENGKIQQSKFDPLFEHMHQNTFNYVVDTGGSTFIDLTKYFEDNNVLKDLNDAGKNVFIHCPIVGGATALDSIDGFQDVLKIKDKCFKIIVWENEYTDLVKSEGNFIVESDLFVDAIKSGKVSGVVKIKYRKDSDTFMEDVLKMTAQFMTFDDVSKSTDFKMMSKKRINTVKEDLYTELDKIPQLR